MSKYVDSTPVVLIAADGGVFQCPACGTAGTLKTFTPDGVAGARCPTCARNAEVPPSNPPPSPQK
jgi:hypothetical protein